MKVNLILHKEFEVDFDSDPQLREAFNETADNNDIPRTEVEEVVRAMLEDDIESLLAVDYDDGDFEIKVQQ